MATLKVNRDLVEDVVAIQLVNNKLKVKTLTSTQMLKLTSGRPLRIEITGDCSQIKVRNAMKIFGDIQTAYAGNVINIEGSVGKAQAGNMVTYGHVKVTKEVKSNNISMGDNNIIVCGKGNIIDGNVMGSGNIIYGGNSRGLLGGFFGNRDKRQSSETRQRTQVLRIDGALEAAFITECDNANTEIIVEGNVILADAGNVLECKGNVYAAQSGNMICVSNR